MQLIYGRDMCVCTHVHGMCVVIRVCDTICAYSEAGVDMVLDRCHSPLRSCGGL